MIGDRSVLVAKTLREAAVRTNTGLVVVAIRRARVEAVVNPDADAVLRAKDTPILVGPAGVSDSLSVIDPVGGTRGS